jgi:hypothetical protein
MTNNAFIFSWDCYGIESIVPISKYETWDQQQLMNMLGNEKVTKNPLNAIVSSLLMRIDCSPDLDEQFWKTQWAENPQFTADLIREKGIKIHSDRASKNEQIKIV